MPFTPRFEPDRITWQRIGIAAFRALPLSVLLTATRAYIVVRLAPDVWTPLSQAESLKYFGLVFLFIGWFCLYRFGWIAVGLTVLTFCVALTAAATAPGSLASPR